MTKLKTRDRKWRHVYPYNCKGCGKRRSTYVFERAIGSRCTKCAGHQVPDNQTSLFS